MVPRYLYDSPTQIHRSLPKSTLYTILHYIQQRGLYPISLYSQRPLADPLAYALKLIVTYTRQVLLTQAYTIHIHALTYTYTHVHTITSSGAYMYIGF